MESLNIATIQIAPFSSVVRNDISLFVVDTETTGTQGVPFWFPQNQVIQYAVLSLEELSWYDRFTNPFEQEEDLRIPLENIRKHHISRQVILRDGVPLRQALLESKEFKKEASKGKTVINIAHNAQFDYDMLMKSWHEQCDRSYEEGCEQDEEYYFDTLAAFKHFYPELGEKCLRSDGPYKLSSIAKEFNPGVNMEAAHNASVDVYALGSLFCNQILPKLDPDWTKWGKFLVCHPLRRPNPPALTLVREVEGYGSFRANQLNQICRGYFSTFAQEEITNLKVPDGFFTCAYLQTYAYLKGHQDCPDYLEGDVSDSYSMICKVIEYTLRKELKVYSDRTIASLLARVCNSTVLDFTTRMYLTDAETPLFPSFPGRAISFLPMEITDDTARSIYEHTGCRTISELYAKRKYLNNDEISHFMFGVNRNMFPPMTLEEIQKHFDEVIKFGG